jgi:hypothetical protein
LPCCPLSTPAYSPADAVLRRSWRAKTGEEQLRTARWLLRRRAVRRWQKTHIPASTRQMQVRQKDDSIPCVVDIWGGADD